MFGIKLPPWLNITKFYMNDPCSFKLFFLIFVMLIFSNFLCIVYFLSLRKTWSFFRPPDWSLYLMQSLCCSLPTPPGSKVLLAPLHCPAGLLLCAISLLILEVLWSSWMSVQLLMNLSACKYFIILVFKINSKFLKLEVSNKHIYSCRSNFESW